MESRKSLMHKRIEDVINNSPTSSPLSRRKSINAQNIQLNVFEENDDEAERIARRRVQTMPTPVSNNSNSKRHSLGLSVLANIPAPQMAESINQCIKLSTENKINIKNAFSLEMIDFMTYMIKKQDVNMSNLQVASTSLDVSTKIYGFRVDSVHTEILKIVGGLDKKIADDDEQNLKEQDGTIAEDAEANVEVQKKKKKRTKQKIISTEEALRGNIEVVKPMSMMIGEGDLQTSDMLYQAMLPNHMSSGFYLHPYNDVIMDVVPEGKPELQDDSSTKCNLPAIDLANKEICASYLNFEFLGWSVEDEPEEAPTTEAEHSDGGSNGFQFDLDASVEQEDDDPAPEPMNYFNIEQEDGYGDGGRCQQAPASRRSENIVDARTMASDYSFVQPIACLHWAGTSHWKFRNFAKSNSDAAADSNMVGFNQAPARRRRLPIELTYTEDQDTIKSKFALSQSNRLQAKTAKTEWSTEVLTLPEDVHYDITRMTKLYLHEKLMIKSASGDKRRDGSDAMSIANVSDNERYDYNNPNDTTEYCPDVNNDNNYDDGGSDRNFEEDATAAIASQGFTGDNLVAAPKLANKIPIAYCLKAKKIDMRQLKKTLWKCLKMTGDSADAMDITEAVQQAETTTMKESKQFSKVYKQLPQQLSKANAEALSVPISFISLLHLANEKELKISSVPDLADLIVEANS